MNMDPVQRRQQKWSGSQKDMYKKKLQHWRFISSFWNLRNVEAGNIQREYTKHVNTIMKKENEFVD